MLTEYFITQPWVGFIIALSSFSASKQVAFQKSISSTRNFLPTAWIELVKRWFSLLKKRGCGLKFSKLLSQ